MPLWVVYHSEGTFTSFESRQAFAKDITGYYTGPPPRSNLPAFHVAVEFIPVPLGNTFVGGESRPSTTNPNPFIRIAIDHIAVRLPGTDAAHAGASERLEQVISKHVAGKGWDWEWHVTETERGLWKINGMTPPPWKSEGETIWRQKNEAVPL